MKLFKSTLLLLAATSLGACGGKGGSSKDWQEAVGMYEATNPQMVDADVKHFFITANGDIYTLRTDTNFVRSYKGEIQAASYTYSDGKFSSGNVEGKRIGWAQAPEELKLMARINEKSVKIFQSLKAADLEFELRLEASTPAFSANQEAWIDLIAANPAKLIDFMKAKHLEAFRVNDYTNDDLYTKTDRLHLPAKISAPTAASYDALVGGTLTVDAL